RAETLWEAARRQGRRVGSMLYPGTDGRAPARSADWGMVWTGDRLARASLQIPRAPSWTAGEPEPRSFSPPRRLTVPFGDTAHSFTLVALDGSDDGKVNYTRLR